MMPIYSLKTKFHYNGQTPKNGDSYFNSKGVDTVRINKDPAINGYCRDGGCKTNWDSINAVAAYIIIKFKGSIKDEEYNTYDECFLMWISDKLFEIHDKRKGKKPKKPFMDTITLNSAYDTYLKNHQVKGDYWKLLDSIKSWKGAYLRYMAEFYMLLNRICKTIVYYEKNKAKSKELSKYSKKCFDQYINLYINISECKSYLRLLNKLKGIYDDFRNYAIRENSSNNNLETNLKKLTKPNGEEMAAVRSFISYKITKKKCNSLDKKADSIQLQSSSKKDPPSAPQQDPKVPPPVSLPQKQDPASSQKNDSLPKSQIGDPDNKNGSNTSDSDKENARDRSGNEGSQSDGNRNLGDESNNSTSNTSGGYFDWGSFFKFILNGTENLKKTSDFIDQNQKKVKEVTDKIINVYNGAMDDLKKVYDKSNKYLNNFISNVTSHLNSIDAPSKSDGNPSGPGKSINGGDSPSQLPSNSPTPQTSQITQNSKEQTTTQESPRGTSGNQNPDQTDQEGPQKIVPDPVTKPKHPGSELKGNGIIEIGDSYVLKEYKKIGLSIIVILIPITLTILHKYLSSGWRKELTRKANMKKVINSIGGKKQIQIIIKSSNQKKNTKKSINSV
ncbi:hypothetical protein YYE_03494, partial [Plasmodium vinckei vinckei]